MSRCNALSTVGWLTVSALGLGCVPTIPEGVFRCSTASECPADWLCEARDASPTPRCYRTPDPTMMLRDAAPDTGPSPRDELDGSLDADSAQADAEPDATDDTGLADAGDAGDLVDGGEPDADTLTCYRWVDSRGEPAGPGRVDPPSLGALPYAVETNTRVPPYTHQQYLCLAAEPDGQRFPGKTVYGSGCLYTKDGAQVIEANGTSQTYTLLVASPSCVDITAHGSPAAPLPAMTLRIEGATGSPPRIPCVAPYQGETSVGGTCDGTHLGYLDATGSQCVFEWYSQVIAVPVASGTVRVFVTQ